MLHDFSSIDTPSIECLSCSSESITLLRAVKLCQACGAVKVFFFACGAVKVTCLRGRESFLCLRGRESFFFACEAVRVFFACGAVKVFFACGVVKFSLPAGPWKFSLSAWPWKFLCLRGCAESFPLPARPLKFSSPVGLCRKFFFFCLGGRLDLFACGAVEVSFA